MNVSATFAHDIYWDTFRMYAIFISIRSESPLKHNEKELENLAEGIVDNALSQGANYMRRIMKAVVPMNQLMAGIHCNIDKINETEVYEFFEVARKEKIPGTKSKCANIIKIDDNFFRFKFLVTGKFQ